MPIQRWATYSVRDHNHPDAFVADVLLYDRLIVPVPPHDEPAEYDRWVREGWAPGRLVLLLGEIKDLVEQVEWDKHRRQAFADHWKAADVVGRDPYRSTREFIGSEVAEGDLVRPVVAYDSERKFQEDIQGSIRAGTQKGVDHLALTFRHRFLVPEPTMTHVERLRRAADLARSPDFCEARKRFYEWQESVVGKGYTDERALEEMKDLLAQYDRALAAAKWKSAVRYGVFAAGLAVPVAKEVGIIASSVALKFDLVIKVIEFVRGKEESVNSPKLAPAAMLHTSIKELGLRGPR